MNLTEATRKLLQRAITFIESSPWASDYLVSLERLSGQMNEPCVLAVAGRVQAGKSTLVNALLGEDLALVGATETTAMINYFRHGVPDDPSRPVACVWTNGRITKETQSFVDALQEMKDISGFEALQRLIHDHFFKRSRLLRCFRIINELGGIVDELQRTRLYDYRRQLATAKKRADRVYRLHHRASRGKSDTATLEPGYLYEGRVLIRARVRL